MNEKYLNDKDVVYFNLSSQFGINGEIMLPLTLVEDLKEHAHAFDGVLKYPFQSIILNALMVYMRYIHCELIPFDSVKEDMEKAVELDMLQEVVVQ